MRSSVLKLSSSVNSPKDRLDALPQLRVFEACRQGLQLFDDLVPACFENLVLLTHLTNALENFTRHAVGGKLLELL